MRAVNQAPRKARKQSKIEAVESHSAPILESHWPAQRMSFEPFTLHDGDTPTVTPAGRPFDMEERTCQLGEEVIRLCKKIPRNPINDTLIAQLVAAATSIGANFHEANDSV